MNFEAKILRGHEIKKFLKKENVLQYPYFFQED